MKKVILIFLCLQILSGNTFGMELMKVHSAVAHYLDHESNEDPDGSFFDFLQEHYVNCNHDGDRSGHCDEKMPFNHCSDCCNHHVVLIPFTLPEEYFGMSTITQTIEFLVEYCEPFISTPDSSIWQPPKLN